MGRMGIPRVETFGSLTEMRQCNGECKGCKIACTAERVNNQTKKKKWLRSGAAFLAWVRAAPLSVVAALWSLFGKHNDIDELDLKTFKGGGRPHHPLRARFDALQIMLAKGIRSENELCKTLAMNRRMALNLGFWEWSKECHKAPHNRVFTSARDILEPSIGGILLDLVEDARKLALWQGEYVMLDSIHLDLCKTGGCKHIKRCPWTTAGILEFPTDCPGRNYEGARPLHKTENERYYGYKLHVAIDIPSGLPLAGVESPASDNIIGMQVLEILHERCIHPRVLLMDKAYDDQEIVKYAYEVLGAYSIVKLRDNWKAIRFPIQLDNGQNAYIAPCGTPLCPAGYPMRYVGIVEDGRATMWDCPTERMEESHMENGRCLYEGCGRCQIVIRPSMNYRRISVPPRASVLWARLASYRGRGEQAFSQYRQNISLDWVQYKDHDSVRFHLMMTLVVALVAAIIAHALRIPEFMLARNLKQLRFIVESALGHLPAVLLIDYPRQSEALVKLLQPVLNLPVGPPVLQGVDT